MFYIDTIVDLVLTSLLIIVKVMSSVSETT